MKQFLVIYNGHSGSADKLSEVRELLKPYDAEYAAISHNQTTRKVAAAVQAGRTIVAAGGDGTVSFVASRLTGTKGVMGVLPLGTLNHFSKDLGIPQAPADAVKTLLAGHTKLVDTARVNTWTFINNASIGLYPRSLRTRHRHQQAIGKWPAAIIGLGKALLHPRRYRVDIVVDGTERTFRTPFVFVGNNPYKLEPGGLTDRKTLDAGVLAVYVIKASNLLQIMRILATAMFTKHRRTKDFEMFLVQKCTIKTRHHRYLHLAWDGEITRRQTPLTFVSVPKSLKVIGPK